MSEQETSRGKLVQNIVGTYVFYVSIAFLLVMAIGQIMGGMGPPLDGLMGVTGTGDIGEDFMESGRWNIESIITYVYPWEELPQAIEKAFQVNEALNVMIRY